ncbi:hypothetical protein QWY93_10060 [Echinicola jeungdonensis]|uniref:Lipoprotein n=1 Tax=Echinicola jeungdonensis TaxID=709343 RepID=A0ABV5J7R7_9BACT|nr:hypothetical protein [Echinicola jeungdonensis]MDN3669669.1 hypothetical protein [Echinicola jeungdonensis]
MKKFRSSCLITLILITGVISSCSCNPEKVFQIVSYFSSTFKGVEDARSIGQFGRVEANINKDLAHGVSTINLKLYNGKLPSLYENEANIARQCAKAFILGSDTEDYDEIIVFIIKTGNSQSEKIIYKSQYKFEVPSLVEE